jgi:serine/threonine protein phosphatase PrpC
MIMPAFDQLQFGPRLDVAVRSSALANPALPQENQDNFLLIDTQGRALFMRDQQAQQQDIAGWPAGHARLAVLDGMGGHSHGREAAEAVVQGLLAIPACTSLDQLSSRLDALHDRLQRHVVGADDPGGRPGTTLTLLELAPGGPALLYHVGDSRLYEIGPDRVTPLTVDHVPATAFAMTGLLGEQEWWQQVHAEHRSQISQAFILGNVFANPAQLDDRLFPLTPATLPRFLRHLPDRRAIELSHDALYLLATDGFWACSEQQRWVGRWPALLRAGRDAGEMVERLFDEIGNHPPPNLHLDNLTAIVLRPLPEARSLP